MKKERETLAVQTSLKEVAYISMTTVCIQQPYSRRKEGIRRAVCFPTGAHASVSLRAADVRCK